MTSEVGPPSGAPSFPLLARGALRVPARLCRVPTVRVAWSWVFTLVLGATPALSLLAVYLRRPLCANGL